LTRKIFFQSNGQSTQRVCDGLVFARGAFFGAHHEVHSDRQFQTLFPKRFPNYAFPAIPNHGVADFATDRKSQSRDVSLIPLGSNDQDMIGGKNVPGVNAIKLRLFSEADGFGESLVGHDTT
jgi:hypothetical protein